jgi:hypothetical protein
VRASGFVFRSTTQLEKWDLSPEKRQIVPVSGLKNLIAKKNAQEMCQKQAFASKGALDSD